MKPTSVSPNYRNDDDEGLDESVIEYLSKAYLAQLDNKDSVNPKILVVFSGGNAVGKSTLARKIGAECSGLVLENDEIKQHLRVLFPGIEREKLNVLTWQYGIWLYKNADTIFRNGLIVRDGVIDWYYDRILPIFEHKGYSLFVVAFDVSPDKAKQLIIKRGSTESINVDRQIMLLEDHAIHTKRFRSTHTADVTLTDAMLFEHDRVIEVLKAKIAESAARLN